MTQDIENFDAIVIGSGQAGNPLAKALAGKGMKTAIIEKNVVGGTCINTGCTPTKAMLASAHAAHIARTSEKLGITASQVKVDFKQVIARKDEIVAMFRDSTKDGLEEQENLELIYGTAHFTDQKTLEVEQQKGGNRKLKADKIFINTGSRSLIPDIEGLDTVDYLDNRTIMELNELPDHLIIIGGGYIGLEFGQMFKRLGSKVTILQKGPYIAEHEDEDVSEAMAEILEEEGINIYCNSQVKSIKKTGQGIEVSGTFPGNQTRFTGSHLLVAVGRVANTEALQLEKTGVKTDKKGQIEVNEKLETNVAGIYALGDVKGGLQFTHVSFNDYKIVQKNLLSDGDISTHNRILTYTVFTDPQLGRAGMNEAQAKEKGIRYKVAKLPMEKAARAIETSQTAGFMKALVDESNDKIIGASILSMEGGEIASALLIAIMGGLTYQQIRDGMFPHPTLAESLNNLFMTL